MRRTLFCELWPALDAGLFYCLAERERMFDMTSDKLHRIVNETIRKSPLDEERYYHLCWCKKKLRCLPALHTKDPHPVFFMAPGQIFAGGLSEHQWRLLERRLQSFCDDRRIRLSAPSSASAPKVPGSGLQITEFDFVRLRRLLTTDKPPGVELQGQWKQLEILLENSDVVAPQEIPDDVVTMNSRVWLKDSRSHKNMVVTLVFPGDAKSDAAIESLRAAIVTPIGLSVFGRRVGDELDGNIKVDKLLFQPEAAGSE